MKTTFSDSIILFGGNSEERLVSVASAQNLSKQIPEAELWFLSQMGEIYKISTDELGSHQNPFMVQFKPAGKVTYPRIEAALSDLRHKIVIIALHGTEGEDGKLQETLEMAQVRYTGTNSKASALAFDKVATKNIARKNNIPVINDLIINTFTADELSKVREFHAMNGKMVLKPFANGSSVGLFIISSKEELEAALKTIKEKNLTDYLAEKFIVGREITVGVRQKPNGDILPLPCSEVRVIQGRQFDYEGKYLGKGVEELTPAPITTDEAKKCQDLAIKVHKLAGCRGYSRTDMILTPEGPILLEINTLPGLSKASFIPQQLIANNENLRDFFQEQINL